MAKTTTRKSIPQTTEILPAKGKGSNESLVAPTGEVTLTMIVASDRVRQNAEAKVAHLMAVNGLHNARQERTAETMGAEYIRLRRMFPAVESVRNLLGEDAPDLAGRSPEYKATLGRINNAARDEIINTLRKEGLTVKQCIAHADEEMERLRKSTTRAIRLAVEEEAKAIMAKEGRENAARFILGHGFGYSGEVTSKNYAGVIEAKSWKLETDKETGAVRLALPEGKTIGEDGRSIVEVNLQQEPKEQSDQTTPSETADALIKDLQAMAEAHKAGEQSASPIGDINLAVGLLNAAAARLTKDTDLKVSLRERNAARKALHSATAAVVRALGGDVEIKAETQEASAK